MKKRFIALLLAASSVVLGVSAPVPAMAQSDTSALSALSALPLASVVVSGGATNGASRGSAEIAAIPVVLSVAGTVLVVKVVQGSARGTVYVLERASDGVRVSVEVVGRGVGAAPMAVGASVTVSVVAAGSVLSQAGEAIAFLPNELGRALLHNERLTR